MTHRRMRVTETTRLALAALLGTMTLAGCDSGCASIGPRFVNHANGTVTDRLTGLQWEKKTHPGRDLGEKRDSPHDVDDHYRWAGRCTVTLRYCQPTAMAAALCAKFAEDGMAGCHECSAGDGTCDAVATIWTAAAERNASRFADETDWRVPTREELISIVDYRTTAVPVVDPAFLGASCDGAWEDQAWEACRDDADPACSCTAKNFYWSSSSSAHNPAGAWVVGFTHGNVTTYNKAANAFSLRLVRGGSWWSRSPRGWGSRVGFSAPTPSDPRAEPTIPPWTPAGGRQLMDVRCCLRERQCVHLTTSECAAAGGVVRGGDRCDRTTCADVEATR